MKNKILMLALLTAFMACKKDNKPTDPEPVVTPVPGLAMFVSTFDITTGTTIYMLDANTGLQATKYNYPVQPNVTWSYPVAGNGLLYTIDNTKINTINMSTGLVQWTFGVDNALVPVLHDQTFYGVYKVNANSYNVYALDATKPTNAYLWKYAINVAPADIKYYNGTVYVLLDAKRLIALDTKTGSVKWDIIATDNYNLTTLNNGVIISGKAIIDANTGTLITIAKMPIIPPAYNPLAQEDQYLDYATKSMYFVRTEHWNDNHIAIKFLSGIDIATGAVKWTYQYDGGFAFSHGMWNYVYQVLNNKLVIQNLINQSSKYGTTTSEGFWMLDMNTGAKKFDFDTTYGNVTGSYVIDNAIFFNSRSEIHLAYPYNNIPPINYLYAIDLSTGKKKWDNNKLLENFTGAVSSCVYTGGKGYSVYNQ